MNFKLINENQSGKIYKVTNFKLMKISNTHTIFGLENYTDSIFYIKWITTQEYINKIKENESYILSKFPDMNISTCIIDRNNYDKMILTKINKKKSLHIVKECGDVSTLREFIEKNKKYNIYLSIDNIFITHTGEIKYSLQVKKIENALQLSLKNQDI